MREVPPETPRQAEWWERTKTHYLRAGLCHRCAAQAAWGHQDGAGGFTAIEPPCDGCAGKTLPPELVERHGTRGVRWLAGHWS